MFKVTNKPIDTQAYHTQLDNPQAGALVIFEGLVRNHNEGLAVKALEYECFEALALGEAAKIIEEAKAKFKIYDLACVHRTGVLEIGELAVWVGATSAHRQSAFAACQYMIDQLKVRLPIWKKEHYLHQEAEWVNCQQCAQHAHEHLEVKEVSEQYYSRQSRLLSQMGSQQVRLTSAKVLVIGAGGLGCPALSYLAAAGVGHLGICDGDMIDLSNLHRQVLYRYEEVGEYKADRAAKHLKAANPLIEPVIHREHIDCENASRLIGGYDLVLDCTDNFASQFLIHDACFLNRTPLVQASIYQFEGQVQVYHTHEENACLRCLWPEQPAENCVGNCAEAGVLGVVPGVLGTWQASEALKLILNLPGISQSETLMVNLLSNDILKLKQVKNQSCPLCGDSPKIVTLDSNTYLKTKQEPPRNSNWEYTASDFYESELRHEMTLIDIRQGAEQAAWQSEIKAVLPADLETTLDIEKPYLLICHKGRRSYQMTETLRAKGYGQVYSLKAGMQSLAPYLQGV